MSGHPDDPAAPKIVGNWVGKYEYMPDKSWKGSGTCIYDFKDGTAERQLGGGFAPQGIHIKHRRHWEVRGR